MPRSRHEADRYRSRRLRCPDRRFPPTIEAAVYFCCAEALQNATKHSRARQIEIGIIVQEQDLRVTVRDDGVGFDATAALAGDSGAGLHNMIDRFISLGGSLSIDSDPGRAQSSSAVCRSTTQS